MKLASNRKAMWCSRRSYRRGLTVLELLIMFSMITLLTSLLLPAIHSAREAARQTQCRNNLGQIGLAMHMHHDTFLKLPAGWSKINGTSAARGWVPDLLPFLEQPGLKNTVDSAWPSVLLRLQSGMPATASTQPNPAARAVLQTPALLSCPSDSALPTFLLFQEANEESDLDHEMPDDILSDTVLVELPHASYVGVSGSLDPDDMASPEGDGILICQRSFAFRDLTRGLSNVAMVSERTARRLPSTWLGFHVAGEDAAARVIGFSSQGPNHPRSDECEFDSRHPACIQMVFADGHVQIVSESIDVDVYRSMARRQE